MARIEARTRDAKASGPITSRMREIIMPHVFNRFYQNATGWLVDFDPGTLQTGRPSAALSSAQADTPRLTRHRGQVS
jgi:hypothetical protein